MSGSPGARPGWPTAAGPPRVLLVGMMGAGKTTVGRGLAGLTGWRYLDNDELVYRAVGRSAAEVLADSGVVALRAAERAALHTALRVPPPCVASVAAGIVDDATDRVALAAGGFVVWLRATLEVLADRAATGSDRPWLSGDAAGALHRLGVGRAARFAEVADLVVDVDVRGPARVAELILAALPDSPAARRPPAG